MSASAKARSRAAGKTRACKPSLPPTDGPLVCDWIETFLVHGEGDWLGKPFRLTQDQRRLVYRIYEHRPDGRRRYRQVLLGRPKGFGKTELGAALAIAELAGPLAPVAPDIPVAAASYEQANLLFGAARTMISEGPLRGYLEVFEKEILRKDGPGRIYRVAAVAGTNDGGRHTFRVADEVHEWEGSKERVHIVLTNGLAKRKNSWALDISTAGSDTDSLIGWLYEKGKLIERGELTDDSFLFDWQEHPDPDCDLSSEKAVRDAVKIAYRGAGDHVDLERIVSCCYEIPEYEWRRYYLNQFTPTARAWLPTGAWHACQAPSTEPPPAGTPIVLGFDGSYSGDSTALVGATVGQTPYLFVVGCWERPDGKEDWLVPREEVRATVDRAFERWKVRELACDPPGWYTEIDQWGEQYGSRVVLHFQTNNRRFMAESCSRFYTAVTQQQLSHDGDSRLARHLANATLKHTPAGDYIVKESRHSSKKIDLAVAAVIAYDRALNVKPVMRPTFIPFHELKTE
jgi:phage terminase large subunit-like protein